MRRGEGGGARGSPGGGGGGGGREVTAVDRRSRPRARPVVTARGGGAPPLPLPLGASPVNKE